MRLKSLALCGMGYSSRCLVQGNEKTQAQNSATLADVVWEGDNGKPYGGEYLETRA